MLDKTYEIMSKNTIVGEYVEGKYISIDRSREPLYLKNTRDFENWLSLRCMDFTRANSRLLKRILQLTAEDEIGICLRNRASKITDTYWVREKGESIQYEDVIFHDNRFDRVALLGDTSGFDLPRSRTPELTNTGSYEKCWHRVNGEWYIEKRQSAQESFSEIFTDEFAKALGYSTAGYVYERNTRSVVSKDFTDSARVCLEEADGLIGSNYMDFEHNLEVFNAIGASFGEEYKRLLFVDALCMNFDRHEHNYGVLRDPDTGNILCMAPNYDNNNSLCKNAIYFEGRSSSFFLEDYESFFSKHPLQETISQNDIEAAIDSAYAVTESQFLAQEIPFADIELVRGMILSAYVSLERSKDLGEDQPDRECDDDEMER